VADQLALRWAGNPNPRDALPPHCRPTLDPGFCSGESGVFRFSAGPDSRIADAPRTDMHKLTVASMITLLTLSAVSTVQARKTCGVVNNSVLTPACICPFLATRHWTLASPPPPHGRIRYPPSSQRGTFGQNFCASLNAAASGARFCVPVLAAGRRGFWTVMAIYHGPWSTLAVDAVRHECCRPENPW
jgi:hypothetical protein